jgi:hypothetical protein
MEDQPAPLPTCSFPFAITVLNGLDDAKGMLPRDGKRGIMMYDPTVDDDWKYVNDLIRNIISYVNWQKMTGQSGRLIIDVRGSEWHERYCTIVRTIVENMVPADAIPAAIAQFTFVRFLA